MYRIPVKFVAMGNTIKTFVLLAALSILILIMGDLVGGRTGLTIAFVIALGINFFSYWFSDRIVLSMYRAKEVSPQEAPRLHALVEEVARSAGIPKPRIYIVPAPYPNAFATGRNPSHAAVAFTEGILRLLDERELKGVIAHELAHIKNRDILISTIAATLATVIFYVADMARWMFIFGRHDEDRNPIADILLLILAPIAAMMIQMAISRTREYLADETGAKFIRDPIALAKALEKLAMGNERVPTTATPTTAHMFIFPPVLDGIARLFSTHPPVEDRIARLIEMARKMGVMY